MIPLIAFSTNKFPWMDVFAESAKRGGLELTQIVNESGIISEKYKAFASNYRHLSQNPVAFELACFGRYFAISDYASKRGCVSFFMSDNDILFNDSVSEELRQLTEGVDVMLSRPHREGASKLIEYSPHFSFWTKEAVNDFIDFVVKTYRTEDGRDLISRTYRSNTAIASYAGVSDMTLCHLWLNANKPRFRNSVCTEDRVTIDHNMVLSDHRIANQFKKRNGIKSLEVVDGKLFFQDNNGGLSYPLVMHFQGKYKVIMKDVLNKKLTWAYKKAALVTGLRVARRLKSSFMTRAAS